jgi:hypothetical protein
LRQQALRAILTPQEMALGSGGGAPTRTFVRKKASLFFDNSRVEN